MVEQFGAGALGADATFFDYVVASKILSVRDLYRVAGSKDQNVITEKQWELIAELDALAAQEAMGMEKLKLDD